MGLEHRHADAVRTAIGWLGVRHFHQSNSGGFVSRLRIMLGVCLTILTPVAKALDYCGELANAYGPFDYRTATAAQKHLVESAHFLPFIEQLQRGLTGSLGSEIDYTLRAFPNHPRALMAMMKLGMKENVRQPRGALWPVECYFDRAVRFAPDDPAVRTLYGVYLVKNGSREAAANELKLASDALEKTGGDANLNYNLGLAYFEMKDYDKALEQAKKAYALGFPLPGLRDKLKRVNKWEE